LVITKSPADLHGGSLTIDSEAGVGEAVKVCLPGKDD
jgi:signal transduction histidine kinase